MAPTEAERFELQQELIGVLKKGPANTLMESLPPMDWHELATKSDLALLKDDLAALEERMNARFEVVDVRLEALRTELGAKIDIGLTALNAKLDTGLTDLNAKIEGVDARLTDVRGEMKSGLAKQTYVMLVGMAVLVTPIYLALFAGLGGWAG